jgi:hypothetical protein
MKDIKSLEKILEEDGVIFLTYLGLFTQQLIVAMMDALEKETQNANVSMKVANNIFTIFIEIAQNMMHYSKGNESLVNSRGLVLVGVDKNGYYVYGQNLINKEDKEKIEKKLKYITSLSKEEIKKKYREVRKSGKDTHDKGGGIGFYEIAKRASKLIYNFEEEEDKYLFQIKAII